MIANVALAGAGFPAEGWQIACIAVSVLVLGVAKTGFGGGIGILSVPLMAIAMPAREMLAVMAVLLVIVDLLANLHFLGEYDWKLLKWLTPGAIIGVILGCVVLEVMRRSSADTAAFDRMLSFTIGLLCLGIVVAQVIRLIGGNLQTLRPGPASGLAVGAVAGSVSTISHSAGPIVTLYLLQGQIDKRRFVGTVLLYTLLINGVKLVAYARIGTVTWETARQTWWMIPLLPIGTVFGAWLNKRVPEKPFAIIMYVAATLAAGQMIWTALK